MHARANLETPEPAQPGAAEAPGEYSGEIKCRVSTMLEEYFLLWFAFCLPYIGCITFLQDRRL